MAQALGGRLVDSSGRGLSVGMIGTVSRQLARRYAELAQGRGALSYAFDSSSANAESAPSSSFFTR